jgi:hypothetical protein
MTLAVARHLPVLAPRLAPWKSSLGVAGKQLLRQFVSRAAAQAAGQRRDAPRSPGAGSDVGQSSRSSAMTAQNLPAVDIRKAALTLSGMAMEIDGLLWKPRPDATASAAEFTEARSLIRQVHEGMRWNPWVWDDRRAEYEAALEVFGQWTLAEPGFRPKAKEELDAEHEQENARLAAEAAHRETERAARAGDHEPARARARCALLEQQALLATCILERDEIAAREMFPFMADKAREQRLAGLEGEIARISAIVDELSTLVGNAESVADANGWLPSERREYALDIFAGRRNTEVRELRDQVKARQAELNAAKDLAERAQVRSTLRKATGRLEFLEAIPPLTAAEMCSECVSPASWHGFLFEVSEASVDRGPCPSWPLWQQQVQKARELLLSSAAKQDTPPPAPKPQRLAVIPSDLPIEEVITRLTAIQAEHPGATVRRGSRSQWEIWPS